MTDQATCPGCGRPAHANECDHCEYFNLASGRYHYCGSNACYCRQLRATIRHDVLSGFAERFAAAGDDSYNDRVRARLFGGNTDSEV